MRTIAQLLFERSHPKAQRWIGLGKALLLLPRSLWLTSFEFETAAGPGRYLGEGLSFEYFRALYGGRIVRETRLPLWRLPEAVRAARARSGITLIEVNRLLVRHLTADGWDASPWVRQQVDLAGARYQSRRRAIEATWGRKVRQHRFECRFSSRPSDVEVFHRELYAPWLRHRYGAGATVRSLASLRLGARAGFLLQVWDGDDWIAGAVVVRQASDGVLLLAPALHPGREVRLKDGALSAVYYFLFRWARDNHVRFVDLGGSRPNQHDGVYQHKARWGAEPMHDSWHHTAVRFCVDLAAPLPETVLQQLVDRDGRLEPIARGISGSPGACAHTRR